MFIVWRNRPVKGTGGSPFLVVEVDLVDKFTCWMPLRCEHRGAGRLAHTPLVVCSERRDGKPRQKLLDRLPTIRTCCIADRFNRAAWWYRVNHVMDSWPEWSDGPLTEDFSRDAPDILRKLREVIPRPSARGIEEFTAYRLAKEAEYEAREEAERQWRHKEAEKQQREREEARRATEGQWHAQNERLWEEIRARLAGSTSVECFAALGLEPGATLDEVKRRHRELAMEHHPDKGGDAKDFARYQAAYERACESLARRRPA